MLGLGLEFGLLGPRDVAPVGRATVETEQGVAVGDREGRRERDLVALLEVPRSRGDGAPNAGPIAEVEQALGRRTVVVEDLLDAEDGRGDLEFARGGADALLDEGLLLASEGLAVLDLLDALDVEFDREGDLLGREGVVPDELVAHLAEDVDVVGDPSRDQSGVQRGGACGDVLGPFQRGLEFGLSVEEREVGVLFLCHRFGMVGCWVGWLVGLEGHGIGDQIELVGDGLSGGLGGEGAAKGREAEVIRGEIVGGFGAEE